MAEISYLQRATPYYFESFAAKGGVLIAHRGFSTSTYYRSDDDGVTWSTHANPFGTDPWECADANGEYFLAVSYGQVAKSTDGITWVVNSIPAHASFGSGAWYSSLAFSGTQWLMTVGLSLGIASTSPDGVTWTNHEIMAGKDIFDCLWDGDKFCVLLTDIGGAIGYFATSPNGSSWSISTMYSDNEVNPTKITHNAGNYIAWGNTPAYVSSNGVDWGPPATTVARAYCVLTVGGEFIYAESGFDLAPRLLKGIDGGSMVEFTPAGLVGSPVHLEAPQSYRGDGSKAYALVPAGSAMVILESFTTPAGLFWSNRIKTTEVI